MLSQFTFKSQELERESKTAGHFPPNSKVTGVRFLAAAVITIRATGALPFGERQIHKMCKKNSVESIYLTYRISLSGLDK